MGYFDAIAQAAAAQPRGYFGALEDPAFYRDMAANASGLLGVPLPTEREGMAMLASDPRFSGPEMRANRAMMAPGEQAALEQSWSDKMNQLGILGLTVYHGSPHKFDKFDSKKIGTGEGAQAYGHGLYLAENPEVAKGYANALQNTKVGGTMAAHFNRVPSGPEESAAFYARAVYNDGGFAPNNMARGWDSAIKRAKEWERNPDQVVKILEKWKAEKAPITQHSNLYTVDLPDEQIAKMLDWDKPLSQQPESVRKAINGTRKLLTPTDIENLGGMEGVRALYDPSSKIDNFLGTWASLRGSRDAGESLLSKAGIPGIKYLDAGSRAAGEGSRNFVVFPGNEGILTILGRQ